MSRVLPAVPAPPEPRTAASREEIDGCLAELASAKTRFCLLSSGQRAKLAEACVEGMFRVARRWVEESCRAKGIDPVTPLRGEEIAAGPVAVVRYLRLVARSLQDIERFSRPRLPGRIKESATGQLMVQVMPTAELFDRVLFRDFKAYVWMRPAVTKANLSDWLAAAYRDQAVRGGVALVLGAGNVSSIAATDALGKLFQEGQVVLLKMNPINDYLRPMYEDAFASLIEPGYLRVISGGPGEGAYAAQHCLVDEVHITGSSHAHEAIVWGPPGPERARRKQTGDPVLKKRITSELGNVTPWIIVPGPYTERELDFQAENVAAMMVNNAAFNCVAAKMIVTHQGWPDRQRFLDKVEALLARIPPRNAYYPGATERFQRFSKQTIREDSQTLPWTLIRNARVDEQPHLFREESFVAVAAETALAADSAEDFVDRVADFVNEELWGTLAAGIMVHPAFRKQVGNEARLQRCISRLHYGTVGINHWPALGFAMMSCPWGGFAGGTLEDPHSGIGWVHNTYLLEDVEKTVLEGPLTMFPKPLWFPTHRTADRLGERLLSLYRKPALWKLPGLIATALSG